MLSIKNPFKKKTEQIQPEGKIEFFKKKYKKEQQKKLNSQERKQRLKNYIERAGFDVN